MSKTNVQKCGTNWRVILTGDAQAIETKHWSMFNHGATSSELEWETGNCAWFWSTPEKILKAFTNAHLFSYLNQFDLIGDEPEVAQHEAQAHDDAKQEFAAMGNIPSFKPFRSVSILNLGCYAMGTGSARAEKMAVETK